MEVHMIIGKEIEANYPARKCQEEKPVLCTLLPHDCVRVLGKCQADMHPHA